MTILTISPCKSTADGEFWELEVVGAAPTTETNEHTRVECRKLVKNRVTTQIAVVADSTLMVA